MTFSNTNERPRERAICCMDDEPAVLEALQLQLSTAFPGYSIELCDDSTSFEGLFKELLADGVEIPVVVCDYLMPGLRGDRLLARVHQLHPATRTIMLTGQSDLSGVAYAINNAGLYRFLTKPWMSTDLEITLREAIRSYDSDQDIARTNHRLRALNEELSAINTVFQRFVPEQFLQRIWNGPWTTAPKPARREHLAVLFSDLRGFTELVNVISPEESVRLLNDYFSAMEPSIRSNGGFIDKFIGDGIMALFEGPNAESAAVRAAVDMFGALSNYNETHPEQSPLRMGVGIHSGDVMIGTVGTEFRMDTTAIGGPVNMASRLEQHTKSAGRQLLFSGEVARALPQDSFRVDALGIAKLKGIDGDVEIFSVATPGEIFT